MRAYTPIPDPDECPEATDKEIPDTDTCVGHKISIVISVLANRASVWCSNILRSKVQHF